jgi:hypothetical protein
MAQKKSRRCGMKIQTSKRSGWMTACIQNKPGLSAHARLRICRESATLVP